MPVLIKDLPKTIQPYVFHGVDLDYREGEEDSVGTCPFCMREKKFSVNVQTGMYRCFICQKGNQKGGGNVYVFLRHFWETCKAATKGYNDLADDRGLLNPRTLERWGFVKSIITGEWLCPGYSIDGKLNNLYKYVKTRDRKQFFPTPGCHHQLHGVPLFDPSKSMVFVCEGPWDAMALWEIMSMTKEEGGMRLTSNESQSLLSDANILAVPNCGAVGEPFTKWLPLFEGKIVNLLFDNDHDAKDEKTGNVRIGGGFLAAKRASALLGHHPSPPQVINWYRWTPEGVFDPNLPDGHDVRDLLHDPDASMRLLQLADLLVKLDTVPAEWISGDGGTKHRKKGSVSIDLKHTTSWAEVVMSWRRALKWTEGHDHGLCTIMAAGTSVEQPGDQCWVKVYGPPASGKTTLAEGFATNKGRVVAKDTFNGFISGYQDGDSEENFSLAPKLNGKMFIVKDGDTVMASPALPIILSQGRALYDGSLNAQYNNKMSANNEDHRMVWILCGTSALRSLDQSELGERFLDCVIMEDIDLELEEEIQWRVANRVNRNLGSEATASGKVNADNDMAEAMALTGGYLEYLVANATDLLSQVHFPQENLRKVCHYARFVAYMRARPSHRQIETAEREFSTRLTSQMVRLAKCMTVVLNKTEVDDEVMRRIHRITRDTARGITLKIAQMLYDNNQSGLLPATLALKIGRDQTETHRLLKFLRMIQAVYAFEPEVAPGVKGSIHWRLTDAMKRLYTEVMG